MSAKMLRSRICRHLSAAFGMAAFAAALTACTVPVLGSSHRLSPAYLYTDKYGAIMYVLRLVQHRSQLTGNAEVLQTVTSKQADEDNIVATILDKNGHVVPWTSSDSEGFDGRPDHGACGGTSACLEQYGTSLTGQLGNSHRVSITFPGDSFVLDQQTMIGRRRGDDLVFSDHGTEITFRPASEAEIQRANVRVHSALPMVIQTADLHDEAQYLKGDNGLADDVSNLKSILDDASQSNPTIFLNPAVCDFQQGFSDQVSQTQTDVSALAKEIEKGRKQLAPYLRPGTALAAYGKHSGYVSELQSAIAGSVQSVDDTVRHANVTIAQANHDAPKIINALNGVGCYVQHVGEAAFHLLPNLLAAG
jgi:hypothetical protein